MKTTKEGFKSQDFILLALILITTGTLFSQLQSFEKNIQRSITIRFVNSVTGYAIYPDRVTISSALSKGETGGIQRTITANEIKRGGLLSLKLGDGIYHIYITANGYQPIFAVLNVDSAIRHVEFNLDPLEYPDVLEAEYLRSLHRSDATLVVGYVLDEETREPISDVSVISLRDGNQTRSDYRGFFKIYIKSSGDSISARRPASLLFEKRGYQSVEYRYIETFPNSDLIYKVKMRKGRGKMVIDERKYRRRINELQDDGDNKCLKCEDEAKGEEVYNSLSTSVVVPLYIRVGRDCSRTSCSRVEYYSLETYCKYVLPAEMYSCWGSLSGGMNSLKAGAVAVRTYGLWFVYNPLSPSYDICDNVYCQVFGNSQSSNTNEAVNQTSRYILVDGSGKIVRSEYSAENNNKGCGDGYSGTGTTWPCIYDPVCLGQSPNGHGRGLCQWGSVRWATGTKVLTTAPCALGVPHGYGAKDWQWILSHYYPSYQIAQAVSATTTSVTASPNSVKPGDSLTIYYSINSTGSINVALGASIAPTGTLNWISDPANDRKVSIPSGVSKVSRPFVVPRNVQPGLYDLLVALWYDKNNNNRIDGYPYDFIISSFSYPKAINIVITSVAKDGGNIPKEYRLFQNYPNPFNSSTRIRFSLPKGVFVRLVIYDALGKEVETIVNEYLNAGTYEVVWDASKYPSGVYYYRLHTAEYVDAKEMILVK